MKFLFIVIGLAVLARAVYIMTVQRDFWLAVDKRTTHENIPVSPVRGNILADDGQLLAASIPEYKLYMDYVVTEPDSARQVKEQRKRDSLVVAKADSLAMGMHRVFPDIDPAAFRKHFLEGHAKKSKHWLLYPRRVSYIEYREVRNLPFFKLGKNRSGFHTEKTTARKNTFGDLAIRTVGKLFAGKDAARFGLELGCDSILRGKPGRSHLQKVLNRYLTIIDEPAQDGYDVQTTLNVMMQDVAEKALSDKLKEIDANYGICILMEVKTGDVKAITSLSRVGEGVYRETSNKAVSQLMEPGSVFKPMSFLVAFNDGYIRMNDWVDVGNGRRQMYGRNMRDANWQSGGSGVLTVPQILQKSSNVGVSTLIDRYYHDNPRKFVEGIHRTGVAEDMHLPLPGYAKPRIRIPTKENWSKTALPWMSIGYETQIPPISTLAFYNGIANNGKMMRPRFIKAVLNNDEVVQEYAPVVVREQMANSEAVKNMQICLESVVSQGLGRKAGSKLFKVSGKTGTAQVWTRSGFAAQYLVSFAGYFPSDAPEYSMIVCIQKGAPASGGGMCAPVFKRVAETIMAQRSSTDYSTARDTVNSVQPVINSGNLVATSQVLSELGLRYTTDFDGSKEELVWGKGQAAPAGITLHRDARAADEVPDLRGYGLRDAVYRLEKMGLRVRANGVGRVSRQSLQAGHRFRKGDIVELTLGDWKPDEEAEKKDVVTGDLKKLEKAMEQPSEQEAAPAPAPKPVKATPSNDVKKPAATTSTAAKKTTALSPKPATSQKKPATASPTADTPTEKKKTVPTTEKKAALTSQKKKTKS